MKSLLQTVLVGAEYLAKRGVEEARLNMEHLLAHVLGCRRLDLYLRFEEVLKETDLMKLRDLTRRRAEGIPLQHLLGTVEFMGNELVSDHRALIPRPETETLCEWMIQSFQTPPLNVLDMACGSGCIGLSLAQRWPTSKVMLADISEEALDLARLNASRLGLGAVQLVRSDLFDKIQATFDLVVANLPYIPSAEIPLLSREVRLDPNLALDGGPCGLRIVTRFLTEVPACLTTDGWIALELGMDQPGVIAQNLTDAGWREVAIRNDLANIPRFVLARKPPPIE